MRRVGAVLLVLLSVLGATACDTPSETAALEPINTSNLRDYLTPVAAKQLQGGRFPDVDSDRPGTISTSEAVALANAWLREFGPYVRRSLEAQHGAAINFTRLVPDPTVSLARSPYTVDVTHPAPVRNVVSDYYLVLFRDGNTPAVTVGVSAAAADVVITDKGLIFPRHYGNEFRVLGVPAHAGYLLTTEEAAVAAAVQSGRRVAGRPEFVTQGYRWYPQLGIWRVPLEGGTGGLNLSWDRRPAAQTPIVRSDAITFPRDGITITRVLPVDPRFDRVMTISGRMQ